MLINYLKIAFRNILKQKGFSFINLLGIAIGVASCLLIALYVQFEFSYDTHHNHSERIFRVTREITGSGDIKRTRVSVDYSMADLLKQNFPEIEDITRLSHSSGTIELEGEDFKETKFFFSEPSFFKIFDVDFLAGDANSALNHPFNAVITRETALKIFGEETPMNKTFKYDGRGPFTVTGIVKKFPANTHFQFNVLASLESSRSWLPDNAFNDIGYSWIYTYLMLPEDYNPVLLEQKIASLAEEAFPQEARTFQVNHNLQPIKAIHLYSNYAGEIEPGGSVRTIYALIGIAGLVLLIACFNYVNLSTARAVRRAREVGMRKTLGADRRQLVFQFLGESVLMIGIGFLLALLLLDLFIPYFNQFIGRNLKINLLGTPAFIWTSIGLVICIGVAAGSYPAFLMSGYNPSQILKNNILGSSSGHSSFFRKSMIVFQFAISVFLIASTMVIYRQIQFAQTKDLGFNEDQVLELDLSDADAKKELEGLKQEIMSVNGVSGVAASSDVPPAPLNSWRILPEGAPPEEVDLMKVMAVDENFLDVMNIQLVTGRGLSAELASDRKEAILLNEAAVEWLGLQSPIGAQFKLMNDLKQGRVVGVIEDFHLNSIHEKIPPVFLHIWPSWYDKLVIKANTEDIQSTIMDIEDIWSARVGHIPFEVSFLDETFKALYHEEQRIAKIMTAGSLLAIFIACLGLVGLISFTVERRTREIGIRKVMGASIPNIMKILSGQFLKLFAMGFSLAVPVIWYIMNNWLQGFAYRIEIGFEIYFLSGTLALLATAASVSYQVIRAANLNPVESLSNE